MRFTRWAVLTAALAGGVAGAGAAGADDAAILTNDSYFRVWYAFRTPVVAAADGSLSTALEPMAKEPTPIPQFQSPLPPAGWMGAEVDDSRWDRQRAPVEVPPGSATGRSPAALHSTTPSSNLFLRGKFVVDDPAKAAGLKLSLEYVGGVVVYVNGKEVARANLPAGELKADTLAERYPDDLYCEPEGMYLQNPAKNPEGFARRYRRLADVAIPGALLRRGTNVLAVAAHRAPVNAGAVAAKRVPVGGMYVVPGLYAFVGIKDLRLAAAAGVQPNTSRPRGLQVFNCMPYQTIQADDWGDPGEPLRPIAVAAARNGTFSGRLVVSSDAPIAGLAAAASELVGPQGAKIPASAIRVRVARAPEPGKSWNAPYRYDGLFDAIPAEIPVPQCPMPRDGYLGQVVQREGMTLGALAPLWLTVRVPADAAAGLYKGTLTVAADGLATTAVPVELTVAGWALPDPADMRTHNLAFNSPESVALHYGVPLWGQRHFELMGKSLALMAEVCSLQVVVDLAIGFQGGGSNSESVIRWIRTADGSYDHDFSIFEKFLDMAAKSVGKPLPLRLNCWGEVKDGKWTNVKTVSLLDQATGKLEPLEQPDPGTAESVAFWRPVLDGVRKRVEARGWWDVTSLGHNSYCWDADPAVIDVARQIWPDGAYSFTSHNARLYAFATRDKKVTMPIRYGECVWVEGPLRARGYKDLLAPRNGIWDTVARGRHKDYSPLTTLRNLPEEMIMRGHDGVGQLGAEFWPLLSDRGRTYMLSCDRGGLGPVCSTKALLYPADDGPIATERFEMLREGIELCEAILHLQRGLEEGRITGDLAGRVNACLDGRARAFLKHWTADDYARDIELLSLCAEAAKAAGR